MIRWGVIGAGGFADKKPIPALCKAHDCQLRALMVRHLDRAKKLAEKHGASKYYDNVDALLDDSDVEAVYIVTPLHLHKEHVIKSAEARKHILCEKPMALTVSECQEMIDACAAKDVKMGIGYMRRFHPYHQKVKELIDSDQIGKIIEARIQTHQWYPKTEDAWRQDPELGGGGAFMDTGSHCLELLQFFLGRVESVNAVMCNTVFDYPVEDISVVTLRFKNGAVGIIDTSFAIPYRENLLEVYGTEGTLLAVKTAGPFTDPVLRLLNKDGEKRIDLPVSIDQYQVQFEQFANCILNDKKPPVDGKDGLENLKAILAIYESARKRKEVIINEQGRPLRSPEYLQKSNAFPLS